MFLLSDYDYDLPEELIAQEAIHPHHNAKMMVIDKELGDITTETTFWNLDTYISPNGVLFLNDSRVVRSRIILKNIPYKKASSELGILNEGEIFYLSSISDTYFDALVRPGNKFKVGTIFEIGKYHLEVKENTESGRVIKIEGGTISDFLIQHGSLPLPPYIKYSEEKESDYQTSFAKKDGSVAAPTASLHFTKELLEKLPCKKEYITLHVGLGTFQGIKTSDVRDYQIHSEKVEISKDIFSKIVTIKSNQQKIIAVGTTATRVLESLPYLWMTLHQESKNTIDINTRNYWDTITETIEDKNWIHSTEESREGNSITFETSIYITPGFLFKIVDELITNFHLGGSSLLVLISAFLGYEKTKKIYEYAIKNKYRFYSFGDGMYIGGK
ncbi:S-adenosylmethionine:tRNA ribosyltransferase-isomerase [Candidatus Gracilibacteria bacterium]|nr:S-adenosylmethionine:tRNA ribosyltransferase-isomerase [Candidatus Gracilibacteria bacterium]